ncbi:LysM peptidoglycan-binding domain-containing protein [Treponema sp. R80B11-R83G3]
MNRKVLFVLIMSMFFTVLAFAQYDLPEMDVIIPSYSSVAYFAAAGDDNELAILTNISRNEYYLRSLELNKMAAETYDYGDYEASAGFAQEAIRYAVLSDEYVSNQLVAEAERLMKWASDNKFDTKFPNNFIEGKTQYENAVSARTDENWNDSIDSAIKAIEIFTAFQSNKQVTTTPAKPAPSGTLPNQYTVRTWRVEKDCLWTIAGYSWVYGDPWKWKVLYDANKDKMPEPANPNLIEPGMVLDIPPLSGEKRQGMWSPTNK